MLAVGAPWWRRPRRSLAFCSSLDPILAAFVAILLVTGAGQRRRRTQLGPALHVRGARAGPRPEARREVGAERGRPRPRPGPLGGPPGPAGDARPSSNSFDTGRPLFLRSPACGTPCARAPSELTSAERPAAARRPRPSTSGRRSSLALPGHRPAGTRCDLSRRYPMSRPVHDGPAGRRPRHAARVRARALRPARRRRPRLLRRTARAAAPRPAARHRRCPLAAPGEPAADHPAGALTARTGCRCIACWIVGAPGPRTRRTRRAEGRRPTVDPRSRAGRDGHAPLGPVSR